MTASMRLMHEVCGSGHITVGGADDDLRRHWVSAGGVVMRRVLRLDDAEYEAVRTRWQAHVGRLCRRDSEAAACRALLEQASEERVEAVGQYGYLTRVGEGDGPDGGVATQRMPSDTLAAVAIGRSKSRGRMWR